MSRSRQQTHETPWLLHMLALLALVVLGGVVYANTLDSPFVLDDSQNIVANSLIRVTTLDPFALFRAAFWSHSPRPVANLSFVLNYALGGYEVRGFHLFNIAVHVVNGMLVYLLALRVYCDARRYTPARSSRSHAPVFLMAVTAAAIFVAHPIQIQSVTYIVQRMTSLSVMFSLIALLLFLHGGDTDRGARRWSCWIGALACWVLAMGCKQIAAPLPFLALLYEWYFRHDLSRDRLRRHWPYFIGSLVGVGLLALLYLNWRPFSFDNRPFDMGERVMTQFRVLWFYLSLLVYPSPSRLNLAHEFSISRSLLDPPTTLLALAGLIALVGSAIAMARSERLASYCILWFFGSLAVESSIVPLELVFEHRLYLPMVLISLTVGELWYRPWRTLAAPTALAVGLVLVLGAATWQRNGHWSDPVTLWTDAVSKSPGDPRAINNLGNALRETGDRDGAIAQFRRATEVTPSYSRAHHNLAITLQEQGRLEEAVSTYRRALELQPRNGRGWRDLGTALQALGEVDEALAAYRSSVETAPRYADGYRELGLLLGHRGDDTEAVRNLAMAAKLAPSDPQPLHALGFLLAKHSRYEDAASAFSQVIRLQPDNAIAHTHLGLALIKLGQTGEAERYLREAVRIDPSSPEVRAALEKFQRDQVNR